MMTLTTPVPGAVAVAVHTWRRSFLKVFRQTVPVLSVMRTRSGRLTSSFSRSFIVCPSW
jgi:hypothetical protein